MVALLSVLTKIGCSLQPLSLEELLKKKQLEQEAEAKVRTISDVWYRLSRPCVAMIGNCPAIIMLTGCLAWAQPKFLSKKQREELALKRREEETALQKQK